MPKAHAPLVIEILPRFTPIAPAYEPKFPSMQAYPFADMQVGDTLQINRPYSTARGAVWRWVKKNPLTAGTFAVRKVGKNKCIIQKTSDITTPIKTRKPYKTSKSQKAKKP